MTQKALNTLSMMSIVLKLLKREKNKRLIKEESDKCILVCANCHRQLHYADVALEAGYAVFRWDKRGTGRSGSGGLGSPIEDAVKAYLDGTIVDHPERLH